MFLTYNIYKALTELTNKNEVDQCIDELKEWYMKNNSDSEEDAKSRAILAMFITKNLIGYNKGIKCNRCGAPNGSNLHKCGNENPKCNTICEIEADECHKAAIMNFSSSPPYNFFCKKIFTKPDFIQLYLTATLKYAKVKRFGITPEKWNADSVQHNLIRVLLLVAEQANKQP